MSNLFATAPGMPRPVEVEIDLQSSGHDLIRQVLDVPEGSEIRERFLFPEHGGEPLRLDMTLRENGASENSCFHIHPCRTVAVCVRYDKTEVVGEFAPNDIASNVLRWATAQDAFKIDVSSRTRMELRTETNVPIGNDHHIGSYVQNDRCGETFIMVEHPKAQG